MLVFCHEDRAISITIWMRKLKIKDESGQSWRTPFVVVKSGARSPFARTRFWVLGYRDLVSEMIFSDIPFTVRQHRRTGQSTASSTALRSRNAGVMGLRNSCLCSKICPSADIYSLQSLSERKPTRFSRIHFSRVLDSWRWIIYAVWMQSLLN